MKLSEALAERRTHKVIGEPVNMLSSSDKTPEVADNIITAASNAPFHYASAKSHHGELTSPVPWRVYKLDSFQCRVLMQRLMDEGDMTKIPNMLAASEFLFQVTWLPDEGTILNATAGKDEPSYSGTLRNMEHIAAGSAFIQSLLLAATAENYRTYWSSGGPLRSPEVFNILDIPENEILLGSVFLFPQDVGNADIRPGSMHDKRGSLNEWSVWRQIS